MKPKIMHNSAQVLYRSPLGALQTGDTLLLRLQAEDASAVTLRLFVDSAGEDHPMALQSGLWSVRLTLPGEPGVLWYYFILDTSQGRRYYGPLSGRTQGEGLVYDQPCPSFQLTVYDRAFRTPDWFRRSTMYQIFPDRFRRGDPSNLEKGAAYHHRMGRRAILHEGWGEMPLYQPLEGEKYYAPCDYFGGDLRGIIDALDELKELGVTLLYLNPIVEADSNHRYNAADYKRVDPFLGTEEEFAELCAKAKERGMRVMLDGVYSHTGSDSLYFNRKGNYPGKGAFQGKDSPYYSWYTFHEDGSYQCWWGFDTLPEVNERDPVWQEQVITGKDSVFRFWTGLGASGFRLDVADELPDDVIELMRTALKKQDPENALLGEVWEDATTKRGGEGERTYALGRGLDSVMNYPFRNAVLPFLRDQSGAPALVSFLVSQQLNYPPPMYYALMNLISSHDIPRFRTILATGLDGEGMSREEQAQVYVTGFQDHAASRLQRLAVTLQYAIPGIPTIYYGDEYGMHGLKDPFNRCPLEKPDEDICGFYQQLGRLRRQEPVLQTGHASFLALGEDVLAVLRFCLGGSDYFGAPAGDSVMLFVINRSDDAVMTRIDLDRFTAGLSQEALRLLAGINPRRAVDLQYGDQYTIRSRRFHISIEAQDSAVLRIEL